MNNQKRGELKRVAIIFIFIALLVLFFVSASKLGITGFAGFSTDKTCVNDTGCEDNNNSTLDYCVNETCYYEFNENIDLFNISEESVTENITEENIFNLTSENETLLLENQTEQNITENITIPSENFTEGNITFYEENITITNDTANFTEETIQGQAVIGRLVRWSKKITIENPDAREIMVSLPKEAENIEAEKLISEKEKIKLAAILDNEIKIVEKEDVKEVLINATSKEYEISYETPAPESSEESVSRFDKRVSISGPDELHYQNILAYSKLSYEISNEEIYLYHITESGKENIEFTLQDTDENGFYDQISWVVPHLSNQTYEIIIITKAEHLDENYTFISDIYDQVKVLDNNWSEEIPSEHYVRVVFEQNLTSKNDITLFPRKVSGNPKIEVYEKDGKKLIAEFTNLKDSEYNKIYLTNLKGEQDTFDLKVVDGSAEFDHIVDPEITPYTGGLLVYSDGDVGMPKYRTFDGTSFGTEQNATSVGASAIEWIRVAACPIRDEWIIATRDAGDVIKAQVCTGAGESISCGAATTINATAGTQGYRNYDVAYEMLSGDAILVYGTATADELRKVEWNGTSWLNDASITTTRTSGRVYWVELTSRKNNDQIGIAYMDSGYNASAYRWNGSAVTDESTSAMRASPDGAFVRKFDVSFEGISGDMLVIVGHSSAGRLWTAELSGTTWTIAAWVGGSSYQGPEFIDIADGDPSTNALSIIATSAVMSTYFACTEWSGTQMVGGSFDNIMLRWNSIYHLGTTSYLSTTYTGVAVYVDSGATDDISWYSMDSAGAWTLQTDNLRTRGAMRHVQLYDYPTTDKVILFTDDSNADLWADTWDGTNVTDTAWIDLTSGGALETSLTSATRQQFDFAFRLAPIASSFGASFGTNPPENYNDADGSITFDMKCVSSVSPSYLQLWTNTTGTWQVNYTNDSMSEYNDTWVNVTVEGIPVGNYKWAVWCNDSSGSSFWTSTNRTFAVDMTPPVAEFGTAPVDNYNATNYSIAFDFKCSDNIAVHTIQLWTNTTGTWQADYTNSSYTNDTWLNVTLTGIPIGLNYKWAVYCEDNAGNSNITDNRTIYNVSYGAIELSSCANLTIPNGGYILTQNISSTANCINISAANVVLDCNGFTINYSNSSVGYGIYSNSTNTTVKNCVVKQTSANSSAYGIYFSGSSSSNGTIFNNSVVTSSIA